MLSHQELGPRDGVCDSRAGISLCVLARNGLECRLINKEVFLDEARQVAYLFHLVTICPQENKLDNMRLCRDKPIGRVGQGQRSLGETLASSRGCN